MPGMFLQNNINFIQNSIKLLDFWVCSLEGLKYTLISLVKFQNYFIPSSGPTFYCKSQSKRKYYMSIELLTLKLRLIKISKYGKHDIVTDQEK